MGTTVAFTCMGESGVEFSSMPNLTPLQNEVNGLHNDLIGINNDQYIQDQRITALENSSGGSSGPYIDELKIAGSSYYGSTNVTAAQAANLNCIVFSGSYNRSLTLPNIALLSVTNLPADTVREGHEIFVSNGTNGTTTVSLSSGANFLIGRAANSTPVILARYQMARFRAVKTSNTAFHWLYMGKTTYNDDLETRLAAAEAKITALEARP